MCILRHWFSSFNRKMGRNDSQREVFTDIFCGRHERHKSADKPPKQARGGLHLQCEASALEFKIFICHCYSPGKLLSLSLVVNLLNGHTKPFTPGNKKKGTSQRGHVLVSDLGSCDGCRCMQTHDARLPFTHQATLMRGSR